MHGTQGLYRQRVSREGGGDEEGGPPAVPNGAEGEVGGSVGEGVKGVGGMDLVGWLVLGGEEFEGDGMEGPIGEKRRDEVR